MAIKRPTNLLCTLPPSTEAVGLAYRRLGSLGEFVEAEALEDLRLLISELVTNSLRHAGLGEEDWVRLEVEVSDGAIRAEVSNPGAVFEAGLDARFDAGPVEQELGSPGRDSGWGLYLVDRISTRWGIAEDTPEKGSTGVWFVLAVGTTGNHDAG